MIPFPATPPAKPTLIVGGYGYRNAGDEAILGGLLQVLGRDHVTVVSRAPAETAATHGVRSVGFGGAPRAMLGHRGLVIGGGGLFGRDMGGLGRLLPLAGLAATVAGREVALLGIGVDRAMPRATALLLTRLAARASSVTVRDEASRMVLADLGAAGRVAPDLSSLVPSAGRAAGARHLRAVGLDPSRRPVVGLALTGVEPILAARVREAIVLAADALPNVDFCLVPMSRHPFVATHNDELLARSVASERPRVRILVPPDDTRQLLGVFEAFAAAVCMRYHSLLFAERAGIPILPIAYADKCRQWLAERAMASLDPSASTLIDGLAAVLAEASA